MAMVLIELGLGEEDGGRVSDGAGLLVTDEVNEDEGKEEVVEVGEARRDKDEEKGDERKEPEAVARAES
jgi:hypothetical protein